MNAILNTLRTIVTSRYFWIVAFIASIFLAGIFVGRCGKETVAPPTTAATTPTAAPTPAVQLSPEQAKLEQDKVKADLAKAKFQAEAAESAARWNAVVNAWTGIKVCAVIGLLFFLAFSWRRIQCYVADFWRNAIGPQGEKLVMAGWLIVAGIALFTALNSVGFIANMNPTTDLEDATKRLFKVAFWVIMVLVIGRKGTWSRQALVSVMATVMAWLIVALAWRLVGENLVYSGLWPAAEITTVTGQEALVYPVLLKVGRWLIRWPFFYGGGIYLLRMVFGQTNNGSLWGFIIACAIGAMFFGPGILILGPGLWDAVF